MKEEIIAMQPELVATSEETTKIMEKIEIDKVDVDAKKELVQADEAVANKAAMEAKAIKPDFKKFLFTVGWVILIFSNIIFHL